MENWLELNWNILHHLGNNGRKSSRYYILQFKEKAFKLISVLPIFRVDSKIEKFGSDKNNGHKFGINNLKA